MIIYSNILIEGKLNLSANSIITKLELSTFLKIKYKFFIKKEKYSMATEKKINIKVNHIIYHEIKKDKAKPAEPKLNDYEVQEIQEKSVGQEFVTKFSENYVNPSITRRTFGVFINEEDLYPAQKYLKEYYYQEKNFIMCSKKIANLFVQKLNETPQSTGGFLFCIDYIENKHRMFAIIILRLNSEFAKDMNGNELIKTENFELNKINMAVKINIDKWENQENVKSYLSFIGGLKGLGKYFYSFIGCDAANNNAIVTNFFMKTLMEHFINCYKNDKNFEKNKKQAKEKIYDLMKNAQTNSEGIDGNFLIEAIFPDEENRKMYYAEYSQQMEEQEISTIFTPDSKAFIHLKRFDYKTSNMNLKISRELFGDKVEFDDNGYLVIKDPKIKEAFNNLE